MIKKETTKHHEHQERSLTDAAESTSRKKGNQRKQGRKEETESKAGPNVLRVSFRLE